MGVAFWGGQYMTMPKVPNELAMARAVAVVGSGDVCQRRDDQGAGAECPLQVGC